MKFSDGAGTPSTIRSSSAWVPSFFVAEPQATGNSSPRSTSAWSASRSSSPLISSPSRYFAVRSSETSTTASIRRVRQVSASADHVGRDRPRLGLARAVARILVGDHVEHVDDAAEVALGPDRDRDRDAAGRELRLDLRERRAEVGAVAVEVVDEDDAR